MVIASEALNKNLNSIQAAGPARSTVSGSPLKEEELKKLHSYWNACNYLAAGMIFLQDNPLLKKPLKAEHIKNRLLGPLGSQSRSQFCLYSSESHDQEARPRHDLHGRGPVMAPRACSLRSISKELTLKFIRTRVKTKKACSNSSSSSPFPAV